MLDANDMTAVARAVGLCTGSGVREDGPEPVVARNGGTASRSRFATTGIENVRGRAAAPGDDR
jgi:hypothetical protein